MTKGELEVLKLGMARRRAQVGSASPPHSDVCRSNQEEKRNDLEEEGKTRCIYPLLQSSNATVDRVQELLQKIHTAFRNRNFVQG